MQTAQGTKPRFVLSSSCFLFKQYCSIPMMRNPYIYSSIFLEPNRTNPEAPETYRQCLVFRTSAQAHERTVRPLLTSSMDLQASWTSTRPWATAVKMLWTSVAFAGPAEACSAENKLEQHCHAEYSVRTGKPLSDDHRRWLAIPLAKCIGIHSITKFKQP
jgi:hypothetical protein